jgi:ABC-type sulfate transport system permease component
LATNAAAVARRPAGAVSGRAGGALTRGIAATYLSVVVLLPLAALVWSSRSAGLDGFWHEANRPERPRR